MASMSCLFPPTHFTNGDINLFFAMMLQLFHDRPYLLARHCPCEIALRIHIEYDDR